MIEPPERSPERDAAIAATLPHVGELGWTASALRAGLGDIGRPPEDAQLLFPGGPADLVEAYADWADRRMEEAAAGEVAELRVSQRVRAVVALRLQQAGPHKEAVRRAVALMTLPRHAAMASRMIARTVDTIWHAAGDRSADFSWYSKRAILTGVYSATVLFWLSDDSEDGAPTLAFLDRRLAEVGRIGQLRRRASDWMARWRPVPPGGSDTQAT